MLCGVAVGTAGILLGIMVYQGTKRKQQKAKEENRHVPYGPYEAFFKRLLDVVLSGMALILLTPILIVTSLFVKIKLGSPVIFTQERPGKINPKTGKEKIFLLYKFRSMTDERDEKGNLKPDAIRLTDFGKKIRDMSIDELPELFNILKGDMSIIGPRPLLVRYLPYYSDRERHRHDIRPGLTGNAQAHGRNTISWERKLNLDIEYVNHVSFLLDMRIVVDTVKALFMKKDVKLNALEDFDEYRKSVQNTNI